MYKDSVENPVAFWSKLAKEYHWEQKVGQATITPLRYHAAQASSLALLLG